MRMIHSTANSSDFDARDRREKKTKQIDFKISFDVNKLKVEIVCL